MRRVYFHPCGRTAVCHIPIFACCKQIRSRINHRTDYETKQEFAIIRDDSNTSAACALTSSSVILLISSFDLQSIERYPSLLPSRNVLSASNLFDGFLGQVSRHKSRSLNCKSLSLGCVNLDEKQYTFLRTMFGFLFF